MENVHFSRMVQVKRAEKLVIHFGWLTSKTKREKVEDDLALIKVNSDFKFDHCVQPACLPNPNFVASGQPFTDTQCWITGFGESQGTRALKFEQRKLKLKEPTGATLLFV